MTEDDAEASDAAVDTDEAGGETATGGKSEDEDENEDEVVDRSVCTRFLECLSRVAPSAVPEAVAAYGPEGTCWADAEVEQVCLTACAESLSGFAENANECRECSTRDDCRPFGERGQCLAGRCVECIDDSHCADGRRCIGVDRMRPTCADSGDEGCGAETFACPDDTSYCIPGSWICDGWADCPSGFDEEIC